MNKQDKAELRKIVREETLGVLAVALPKLAERLEKAISSVSTGNSNHPEDALLLDSHLVRASLGRS